jgi:hypothetical protein
VVATTWPVAYRAAIESEFQKWQATRVGSDGRSVIRLTWLPVERGDHLIGITRRTLAPDVIAGINLPAFDGLDAAGSLLVADGQTVGCRVESAGARGGGTQAGDPRTDAATLGWALDQLEPSRWREGYAGLVQWAGNEPRIGTTALSTDSAASRSWEGVAILKNAPEPARARAFLQFLLETKHGEPIVGEEQRRSPYDAETQSLVADLLGSTLVDAQDELWVAWRALEAAGSPERARAWLTEPPPWPPASIEKYLKREGENAMKLIETLAAELAPQPAARAWLVRSWLAPPKVVDAALLTEMAHAAEGALGRERWFRAWLRAEWTASARQRYRRVTRLSSLPKDEYAFPDSGGQAP